MGVHCKIRFFGEMGGGGGELPKKEGLDSLQI